MKIHSSSFILNVRLFFLTSPLLRCIWYISHHNKVNSNQKLIYWRAKIGRECTKLGKASGDICFHFPVEKLFSIMNAYWLVFENISAKTF